MELRVDFQVPFLLGTMLSESYRPTEIHEVFGHDEAKALLRDYLNENPSKKAVLLLGTPGIGKCHGIDTPILMYDGSIKMVQDIEIGDVVMGDDSTPRNVIGLGRGVDMIYEIVPAKGEPYKVNSEHILCLKQSGVGGIIRRNETSYKTKRFNSETKRFSYRNFSTHEDAEFYLKSFSDESNITEISVKDYLGLHREIKQRWLKGYRCGVDFPSVPVDFDPYILGLWLGDGSSSGPRITSQDSTILHYLNKTLPSYNLTMRYVTKYDYDIVGIIPRVNPLLNFLRKHDLINNKHIPRVYKTNSRDIRLKVLAGLIDTDGHYAPGSGTFEIAQKSDTLANDIQYIARSLGFACYNAKVEKYCMYKGEKRTGKYNRLTISGNINEIPVKIQRKVPDLRKQVKNHLVYGFTVNEVGVDNYYGFTLDGNNRYLLGDFTVTHNTSLVLAAARSFGYEPLEVNASRAMRSYTDVDSLRDSCRAPISIQSLLQGNSRRTCVVLDEVDGSDPHAQRRILEWIRDPERVVPILMTSNEEPVIFKRAKQNVHIHRCMPCSAQTMYETLKPFLQGMPFSDFQQLTKECLHDVRRILHRVQYGRSDAVKIRPLTGNALKDAALQQDVFYGKDPIFAAIESIETEPHSSHCLC